MPQRFRAGVDGEMLRAGLGLEMSVGGVSLKSPDDSGTEHASQVRILTVSLHSPAPAGIPEYVDIRGPESKAGVLKALAILNRARQAVLDPGLVTDRSEHFLNQLRVEGSGHADRHRVHGGVAVAGNTMQSLVPPVVSVDSETWNRLGIKIHQGRLFLKGEPPDEILRPLFRAEVLVHIRQLSGGRQHASESHEGRRDNILKIFHNILVIIYLFRHHGHTLPSSSNGRSRTRTLSHRRRKGLSSNIFPQGSTLRRGLCLR